MEKSSNTIELNFGDLLFTKSGICFYVQKIEYTDEFNELNRMDKYLTLRYLNGNEVGRTTWREEYEVICFIKKDICIHLPVTKYEK